MNVLFADTLEQALQQFANQNNMEGVASAVVFPDGTTWSGATGSYGAKTLHTNLLFDIGSNTKTMISTIIMMMEEEGKLSINDTLYKYISPIPHVPNSISLKLLLNHRSGIANYTEHPDFIDTLFADPNFFWHPDTILKHFTFTPKFPAGTSYDYSNTNYILLGKVIEAVEGLPLNQVIHNRIFIPLQMNQSYLESYDTYTLEKTGAYMSPGNYWDSKFNALFSSAWAAGAVVSTPDDFAWWCYKLFRGDILTPLSLNRMKIGTQLGGYTYGLGIESTIYKGREYYLHGGTTMQNSEMHYSVESDFSVVVMNLDQGFITQTVNLQHTLIDLLEYIADQPLSIEEKKTTYTLRAFPNPGNSVVTIEFPDEIQQEQITIEVYDLMGKLIFQKETRDQKVILNKVDFGAGVFLIKTFSESTLFETKTVVFN
ncbi:serine hydrolase [bacterium SCSIO 12643]|nr:serine hydrolase [bacterium SCSIO 12643]